MSDITDSIQARIEQSEAEEARIMKDLQGQVAELRGQRQALTKFKAAFEKEPGLEALLAQAKALGLL
jgi:chromosome condensin MukBEF ATPase and DNA-binding subunit MukB